MTRYQEELLAFAETELHKYLSRRAKKVRGKGHYRTVSTGVGIEMSVDVLSNRLIRVSIFSGAEATQIMLEEHCQGSNLGHRATARAGSGGKSYVRFEWAGGREEQAKREIAAHLRWLNERSRPVRRGHIG